MKRLKRVFTLLMVVVLTLSLCGCSFKLPWDKEDGESSSGVGDGLDDFGDWDMPVESVAEGMIYNVGDTITATGITNTDPTKQLITCVFVVDGEMAEEIVCDQPGDYMVTVIAQYSDGTEWSDLFSYTVEGSAVQIPQNIYDKLASSQYVKRCVPISDTFRISTISIGEGSSSVGVETDNIVTHLIKVEEDDLIVRGTAKADTISKYYDKTLADAITTAYYLTEVLGESWGTNNTVMKLVKVLYGEEGVAAAQNLLSSLDGADPYTVLAMLANEPGLYSTSSLVYDLSNSIVSSTISDSGSYLYSTNGDAYPVRKISRTFDGTQILGTVDGGTFSIDYIATVNPENVVVLSDRSYSESPWGFRLKGYDGSIADLLNDDSLLAETALGISVPAYSDSTFENMANMATWVRSLFVGDNAIFEATYNGTSLNDFAGRYLDRVLVGDYTALQVDQDATGSPDVVDPGEVNNTEDFGNVDDGIQVVYKKSYQQQHPGLFEWPEADVIYRRWIYTINEDDPYQGTIYLADGTVLQGTSGLNTWTGEYTPTTDYTTKTHTMRTSSMEYDLTNEKDTSYVINTGRSNSSTTSITKGSRDYILSNVSEGWITNATNSPVYQSWQNAANFEAKAANTYSNNGFLITPYTAKIVTGAGTTEYPYFVQLDYGNDHFVVYGATNDVDLNEMLYIADNIIKASPQEDQ